MSLPRQFQASFFLWKDFERKETQIKPKATKKIKKANKNNKNNIFSRMKTSKRSKIGYLRFDAFCMLKIFS